MSATKVIRYTVAEPTQGVFPLAEMSAALQKALQRIKTIEPNCFQRLRERWREERDKHSRITERPYQMRLAEINREELRFGDVPSIQIEGWSVGGIPILLTVGEKVIIVRFTKLLTPDEKETAAQIIPDIEKLIAQVHPPVRFTDNDPH